MNSRVPGAIVRAAFVVALIMMPSVLFPGHGGNGVQIVTLFALFGAVFTMFEYTAASPSLVEFRSAPPFNRLRFGALFITVLFLSLILRGDETVPSGVAGLLHMMGQSVGVAMDFPYSPVHLMLSVLPPEADANTFAALRTAAGLSYAISLLSLVVFVVILRFHAWPKRRVAFNVWVNLPTFNPAAGGDIVDRLNRDSQINLILGFLLPFLIPVMMRYSGGFLTPFDLGDPQTLIWMVATWAFLPAGLLMRGVALSRVAQMIYLQRKHAHAQSVAAGIASA